DEKKKNIQDAIDLLSNEFRASSIEAVTVIPISAYAEYDKNTGEVIYNENNKYWHIDELIEYIVENLPNNAQFKMARLGKVLKTQIKIAETIVGITAIMCGLFALTPIPFADAIPITSSQITMITAIVYVAGKETSEKLIRDFIVALGINIGAAVALREIAHTLPRLLFPGIGNMVSASVATTGTIALGQAAFEYFIKQKPIEEVRSSFKRDKPIITFRFDPIIKLIIGKIIKIKGDVVGGDKKIRRGKSQTSRVSKTRKT
ncbi:MAG: hypothetical protein HZB17_12050, partial [Chloroflexi bacterium]|nr:hypothetical protein [Chloroflexota bacterium]